MFSVQVDEVPVHTFILLIKCIMKIVKCNYTLPLSSPADLVPFTALPSVGFRLNCFQYSVLVAHNPPHSQLLSQRTLIKFSALLISEKVAHSNVFWITSYRNGSKGS